LRNWNISNEKAPDVRDRHPALSTRSQAYLTVPACLAAAAVARFPALTRDFALLGGIHRRKSPFGTAAFGRCHASSPSIEWRLRNANNSARFTKLMEVR